MEDVVQTGQSLSGTGTPVLSTSLLTWVLAGRLGFEGGCGRTVGGGGGGGIVGFERRSVLLGRFLCAGKSPRCGHRALRGEIPL